MAGMDQNTRANTISKVFSMLTLLSAVTCGCVCSNPHLESFAAIPPFPQRSPSGENDMFSHRGCSRYFLIAKLTPDECPERVSPHIGRVSASRSDTSGTVQIAGMLVSALPAIFTDKKDTKNTHWFVYIAIIIYCCFGWQKTNWAGSSRAEISLRVALSVQYRCHLSRNAEVEVMQVLKPFYRGVTQESCCTDCFWSRHYEHATHWNTRDRLFFFVLILTWNLL